MRSQKKARDSRLHMWEPENEHFARDNSSNFDTSTTSKSKGFKDLHLIMGQKHLIWDRVWNVRSTRSNLYLHLIYSIYMYTYMFLYPYHTHLLFFGFLKTRGHHIKISQIIHIQISIYLYICINPHNMILIYVQAHVHTCIN